MFDLNSVFAVISAHSDKRSDHENSFLHEQLGYFIKANGYDIVEVDGVYNDIKEKSYLVTGRPSETGWPLNDLMKCLSAGYNQESYLVGDGAGTAYLFRKSDNDFVKSHLFNSCREAEPKDTSYTVFPNGRAYTLCCE